MERVFHYSITSDLCKCDVCALLLAGQRKQGLNAQAVHDYFQRVRIYESQMEEIQDLEKPGQYFWPMYLKEFN